MSELLEFMQTKLKFGNPCGEPKTGLYPHQVEWVKHYEQNQEVFWGLSRQIGTTHVLAGICIWEMLNKPGFQIVTDNKTIIDTARDIISRGGLAGFNTSSSFVLRGPNHSKLEFIRDDRAHCETCGGKADLIIVSPDCLGVGIAAKYCQLHKFLKSDGKAIVASLPGSADVNLFFSLWKESKRPFINTDFTAIASRNFVWLLETRSWMNENSFAIEYGCDFTKTRS